MPLWAIPVPTEPVEYSDVVGPEPAEPDRPLHRPDTGTLRRPTRPPPPVQCRGFMCPGGPDPLGGSQGCVIVPVYRPGPPNPGEVTPSTILVGYYSPNCPELGLASIQEMLGDFDGLGP